MHRLPNTNMDVSAASVQNTENRLHLPKSPWKGNGDSVAGRQSPGASTYEAGYGEGSHRELKEEPMCTREL